MAAHDKLNEGYQHNYRKTCILVKRSQAHLTQIVRAPSGLHPRAQSGPIG